MRPPYKSGYDIVFVFVITLILFLLMSVLMLWGVPERQVKWIAGTFFVACILYVQRDKFTQIPRAQRVPLIILTLLALAFCYYSHDPVTRLFARLTS